MAQRKAVRSGYVVIHPNRERPICTVTRLLVVLFLLASVALMLLVTIGGWSKLEGMTPVDFIWCAVYVVVAFFVARWSRGLLPIAAILAVLLLAIDGIASLGLTGTSWYDRAHAGFGAAHALGGGVGFSANLLGTLTVLIVVAQVLLFAAAVVAFGQGWNVEREVPEDQAGGRSGPTPGPQAAAT